MFGPWASIPAPDPDVSTQPTKMKETYKRCDKCGGSGIVVNEDWIGNWTYKKCKDCEGNGKILVDMEII